MARTTDAAVDLFYSTSARDCACGCDGHGVQVDGAKVFDAAMSALRDADFDESKHERAANGQFGKGTTVTKVKNAYGQERHEVYHEGKHLGRVSESMQYPVKANGKATSSGPMVKRWSHDPARPDGGKFIRGESGMKSKKEAVKSLKLAHGIRD